MEASPGIGHNFGSETVAPQSLTPTSAEKLKQFIARVEKLNEEKKALATDLKEVYAEAKVLGFDTKAIRSAVKFRAQDRQEREEAEAILELYLATLGDI